MIDDGSIIARPGDEDPGAIALMHKLAQKSRDRWPGDRGRLPEEPAEAREVLSRLDVDEGPLRDLLMVALGFATGVLSGLFGVGGGVISQPGMRLLGVAAARVIGTALPVIIPGATSGTIRYRHEGLIRWRAFAATVPVGLVAAVAGAALSEVVPGRGPPAPARHRRAAGVLRLPDVAVRRRSRRAAGRHRRRAAESPTRHRRDRRRSTTRDAGRATSPSGSCRGCSPACSASAAA